MSIAQKQRQKSELEKKIEMEELKLAIGEGFFTVAQWVATLRNPDGEQVTRTNANSAINRGTPEWLLHRIKAKIESSRRDQPDRHEKLRDYYMNTAQ